ncbi:hypothetical protein [Metallosphaera cuprina]|uniref:hypothetical protein n=1 Tax=Metallosphaera cuprina TaxID=1006005 RepID=UPI0011D229C6|nr:hypothetical protein [Metallosphaera cuprina]
MSNVELRNVSRGDVLCSDPIAKTIYAPNNRDDVASTFPSRLLVDLPLFWISDKTWNLYTGLAMTNLLKWTN